MFYSQAPLITNRCIAETRIEHQSETETCVDPNEVIPPCITNIVATTQPNVLTGNLNRPNVNQLVIADQTNQPLERGFSNVQNQNDITFGHKQRKVAAIRSGVISAVSKTNTHTDIENSFEEENYVDKAMKKKPKNCNFKHPLPPARNDVNQALTLQTETNNLLKHIISQNNKQIQLLDMMLKNSSC